MTVIYTDHSHFPEILTLYGHENSSLGNHLLNFFFCCNLSNRHSYELRLPKLGNLERVVEHNLKYDNPPKNLWQESNVLENSYLAYLDSIDLLDNGLSQDTIVKGLFWHYPLIDLSAINKYCRFKKPYWKPSRNDVIVHIRGRDFVDHGKPYFKSLVPKSPYYRRAFEKCYEYIRNPSFKLLTDDEDLSKIILKDHSYETIRCDSDEAWLIMKNAQNMIASCSCFSWTASIFNKDLLIQPLAGYNFETPERGEFRYGFAIDEAIQIDGRSDD